MISGFVFAAIGFCAGVFGYDYFNTPTGAAFIAALIFVSAVKSAVRRKVNIYHLVLIAALIFGMVIWSRAVSDGKSDLEKYELQTITAVGIIADMPQQNEDMYVYGVNIKSVITDDEQIPVKAKIRLTAAQKMRSGDTVKLTGVLKPIPSKLTESGFDYRQYYGARGMSYKIYDEYAARLDERLRYFSAAIALNRCKCYISDIINAAFDGDDAALINAVITGEKHSISDELNSKLLESGLRRYLYPAFLHAMLISWIIGMLTFSIKKKYRNYIILACMIVYSLANSTNSVVLKLAVVACASIMLKQKYGYEDRLDTYAIAVLTVGISNPYMLYDLGMQMSLITGLLMYYFGDHLKNRLWRISSDYVKRLICFEVIHTISLLPYILYVGGSITIYSIPASVIIIPLVIIMIALFPPELLLLLIFKSDAVIGNILVIICRLIELLADFINMLPLHYITVGAVGIWTALAIVFVFGMLKAMLSDTSEETAFMVICACVCSAAAGIGQLTRINTVECTFVNIGQGDAAVITIPFRKSIIIDGGGSAAYTDYNLGEEVYVPYMQSQWHSHIDTAVLSHYDKDHAQGIVEAVKNLSVDTVYAPMYPEDEYYRSELTAAAEESGTRIIYVDEPSVLDFGYGLTAQLIPYYDKNGDSNDNTLLARFSYYDTDIFFTGDISSEAADNLTLDGFVTDTEIVKAPHHGSRGSLSYRFIDALSPQWTVFSVGEDNQFNFPSDAVVRKYENTGSLTMRTDIYGDIKFVIDKNGIRSVKTSSRSNEQESDYSADN